DGLVAGGVLAMAGMGNGGGRSVGWSGGCWRVGRRRRGPVLQGGDRQLGPLRRGGHLRRGWFGVWAGLPLLAVGGGEARSTAQFVPKPQAVLLRRGGCSPGCRQ